MSLLPPSSAATEPTAVIPTATAAGTDDPAPPFAAWPGVSPGVVLCGKNAADTAHADNRTANFPVIRTGSPPFTARPANTFDVRINPTRCDLIGESHRQGRG